MFTKLTMPIPSCYIPPACSFASWRATHTTRYMERDDALLDNVIRSNAQRSANNMEWISDFITMPSRRWKTNDAACQRYSLAHNLCTRVGGGGPSLLSETTRQLRQGNNNEEQDFLMSKLRGQHNADARSQIPRVGLCDMCAKTRFCSTC